LTEKGPESDDPTQNKENRTWILSEFERGEENKIFEREREEKGDRLEKVREREKKCFK